MEYKFLLYGATGYTGSLILEQAVKLGMSPIIAGRDESKLTALANYYGIPYRVFSLKDRLKMEDAVTEVPVVLNAAGPYAQTASLLIEACLNKRVHYLDLSFELSPLMMCQSSLDLVAKGSGVMLLPGVGFGVSLMDYAGQMVKDTLPDVDSLKIFISGIDKVSRGTLKSFVPSVYKGIVERRGGWLHYTIRPRYERSPFEGARKRWQSVPWGAVITTAYTTSIANITTYIPSDSPLTRWVAGKGWRYYFYQLPLTKRYMARRIEKEPYGPTDEERRQQNSSIYVIGSNEKGEEVKFLITTPDPYSYTVHSSLEAVKRVIWGEFSPGFQTTPMVFDKDFFLDLPGINISSM